MRRLRHRANQRQSWDLNSGSLALQSEILYHYGGLLLFHYGGLLLFHYGGLLLFPSAQDAIPKWSTLSKLCSRHWATEIEDPLALGWSAGVAVRAVWPAAKAGPWPYRREMRNNFLVHSKCLSSQFASGWSNGFWAQGPTSHSWLLTG